jgi:phage baseplate assembly protein W
MGTKIFGLKFPVELVEGSPVKADLKGSIESCIKIALNWPPLTRPFSLGYSLDLRPYLQEPNDPITQVEIRKRIYETLRIYEPRIQIQNIEITPGQDSVHIILSTIIKDTQETLTVTVDE